MSDSKSKICSVSGCDRPGRRLDPTDKELAKENKEIVPKRYCEGHFKRLLEYGDPTAGPEIRWGRQNPIPEGATCTVPGCERKMFAKNLCQSHYQRQYRSGDVKATVPVKPVHHHHVETAKAG